MAVHFLVVAGVKPEHGPWVDCVSDGESPYLPSFDPRRSPDCTILHDTVVDATPPEDFPNHACQEEWPAIEAIAKLDEASYGGRDCFHRAMAKIFEMGMAAQHELDCKAREVPVHADQPISNQHRLQDTPAKRDTARDDYYAGQHE